MADARIDIATPAARLADLVAAVPDAALDGPTPCPDLTVGQLVQHVEGFCAAFGAAAAKREVGPAEPPPLGDGWRTRIGAALRDLGDAWAPPAAWTGDTVAAGVPLPAPVAGLFALDEVVVHTWDLAVAIGADEFATAPQPAAADALEAFLGDESLPRVPGLFGAVVAVPDGASRWDRVIGLAGRDPAWRPPG